jgi:gliding motility-associated-like protein
VCEQLTIVEIPEVREDFILSQCDIGDDNPNDGLSEFNLQLARDYLTNGDNGLQIYFYEDKANARSDVSNEKALNNIYRNKTPEQILFAKVVGFGSECFAISPITLKTTGSNKIYPTTAFGCDTGNNEGFFNFLKIEENIVSELSLGDGIQLTFHLSKKDAEVGINALPDDYTTSAIPVYIRAYKDNTCYGFGSIDLKLNDFPDIINEHVLIKCSEDFPMILGEEINLEDPSKYIFSWSTGEKTPIINIQQGGIYSLNLLNEELGCGKTIEYIVEEQSGPIISNIEIINNGNQSDLKVFTEINDENVMYSLDSPNGPFQSSSIFRNVPGGEHIVFAKKNNGCEISEKKVLVFGMPSYFTPNNDGYNDTWKPLNIDQLNLKMVGLHIYDRYGKLLKQLDPYGKGWDGTFNDLEMPSNDYWYSISFEDGNTFQGHFTLLR